MHNEHISNSPLQPANIASDLKVDIAIFSAMPEEVEFYRTHFAEKNAVPFNVQIKNFNFEVYQYHSKKILLGKTGLGTTFAASVLTMVNHTCHPDYVFLSGTAGGIKPDLKIKDVVIVDNAFEAEIQGIFATLRNTPFESCLTHPLTQNEFPAIYPASKELLALAEAVTTNNIVIGKAVSSNTFPSPKELFERIKELHAYSIDMETSAFYQVAWLLKLNVLAVRGISNILNLDGTDDNVHESDVHGSAKAAADVVMNIVDRLIEKQISAPTHTDLVVSDMIENLTLQPHPEGGYYKRNYTSTITASPENKALYGEPRPAGTAIYYLLKGDSFSAWHTLNSDELWHFYEGSTVKIYELKADGELHTHLLGSPALTEGAQYQIAIPAHSWFAAEVVDKHSYCLVGCTVNPGFDVENYHLAERQMLTTIFPQHAELIKRLTRLPVSDDDCSYNNN